MANMVFRRMGTTQLVAHGRKNPTDAEWAEFVAASSASLTAIDSVLVFTAGGALNAAQRAEVQKLFGRVRISVLTDSIVARGVVTALGWFGVPIRAFPPGDLEAAMNHLRVAAARRAELGSALNELKARVS